MLTVSAGQWPQQVCCRGRAWEFEARLCNCWPTLHQTGLSADLGVRLARKAMLSSGGNWTPVDNVRARRPRRSPHRVWQHLGPRRRVGKSPRKPGQGPPRGRSEALQRPTTRTAAQHPRRCVGAPRRRREDRHPVGAPRLRHVLLVAQHLHLSVWRPPRRHSHHRQPKRRPPRPPSPPSCGPPATPLRHNTPPETSAANRCSKAAASRRT